MQVTVPPIEKIPVWGPQGFLGWSCSLHMNEQWYRLHGGWGNYEEQSRAMVHVLNTIHADPSAKGWSDERVPYDPWNRTGGGLLIRWFKHFDPRHDDEPSQV